MVLQFLCSLFLKKTSSPTPTITREVLSNEEILDISKKLEMNTVSMLKITLFYLMYLSLKKDMNLPFLPMGI